MSNYQVDREKWARLTIFEQMGNIGSEVGRASIARDKGNQQRCDAAFDRALDLFDATLFALRGNLPRMREVARSREVFTGEYESGGPITITSYFDKFAVAARLAATA